MNRLSASLRRSTFALIFVAGCATTAPSARSAATATSTAPAPAAAAPPSPAIADASASALVDASAPTPIDSEVAQGHALFERICAPCHEGRWRVPTGGTLSRTNRTEAAI